MNKIFYPRTKCKYGMSIVTNDESLTEIFTKRYDCLDLAHVFFDEKTEPSHIAFAKFSQEIQAQYKKNSIIFYYDNTTQKSISYEPKDGKITEIIFENNELRPIQVLENLLFTSLIPEDEVIALHGGAIAKNGKAILLLASTTCGKSTLTGYLWQAGYEYITDDEIFISRKDIKIEPVRKNLSLRQGGFDLIGSNFKNSNKIYDGKATTYIIKPQEDLEYLSYDIDKVVFLAGYGSDEPYFRKTEPREAFLKLLKGQLSGNNSEGNVEEKYKILSKLAKKSYEMRYSDLWTAEKFLKHSQI